MVKLVVVLEFVLILVVIFEIVVVFVEVFNLKFKMCSMVFKCLVKMVVKEEELFMFLFILLLEDL